MRRLHFLPHLGLAATALVQTVGIAQYPVSSAGRWQASLEFAQNPFDSSGPPSIFVSGTGEVILAPDRAVLRFSVVGMGPSAAEASAQSAQKFAAIVDTLRRRGVHPDSVKPGAFFVGQANPDLAMMSPLRRPTDYTARNELRLTVRDLGTMVSIVDAVLAAGASELAGVQYMSDRVEQARRDALQQSFAKARQSAEVLATAAGRRLGELMWISTSVVPGFDYSSITEMSSEYIMAATGRGMRSTPREVVVRSTVQVRWRLEPPR